MITNEQFARLEREVIAMRNVSAAPPLFIAREGGGIQIGLASTSIYGKITANDPAYTFVEVVFDGENWIARNNAITGVVSNLAESTDSSEDPVVDVDSIVLLQQVILPDSVYYFMERGNVVSSASALYGKITANDPAYTFVEVTYDGSTWSTTDGGVTGAAINLDSVGEENPELVPVDSIVAIFTLVNDATTYYVFSRAVIPDYSGGTVKQLGFIQGTQDTDTWDRDSENVPLEVQVVTDAKYDATTHKITVRTRTLSFDRGGNLTGVSAESDLVEITEAVPGVAAE